MRTGYLLTALLTAHWACEAVAEPYEDHLVRIEVPTGYDGPVSASQGASVNVVAFRWKDPDRDTATLLQITEYDVGSALTEMPPEERGNAAERYLLQFLAGIERRRSAFETSGPVRLPLGGLPGAKIAWRGTTLDKRLSGVMYCVVVGTTVVSLHTQDFEPAPEARRDAIVRAIESMALTARTAEDREP